VAHPRKRVASERRPGAVRRRGTGTSWTEVAQRPDVSADRRSRVGGGTGVGRGRRPKEHGRKQRKEQGWAVDRSAPGLAAGSGVCSRERVGEGPMACKRKSGDGRKWALKYLIIFGGLGFSAAK
jgi:hypothetical protein